MKLHSKNEKGDIGLCVVSSKVIDKETLLLPALEEDRYVIVK